MTGVRPPRLSRQSTVPRHPRKWDTESGRLRASYALRESVSSHAQSRAQSPRPGPSFVPARSGSPSRPRAICAPRPLSCNSLPRRTLWRFGGRLGDRRRWRNTTAGLSHLSPRSDQRIRRAEAGMLGRRVSRWGSFGRPDRTDVALGKRSAGFRHHPSAGPAPRADSHRNPLRYALEERRRQGPAKITAWPRQDHGQGRRRQHAGRHEGPPAGAG